MKHWITWWWGVDKIIWREIKDTLWEKTKRKGGELVAEQQLQYMTSHDVTDLAPDTSVEESESSVLSLKVWKERYSSLNARLFCSSWLQFPNLSSYQFRFISISFWFLSLSRHNGSSEWGKLLYVIHIYGSVTVLMWQILIVMPISCSALSIFCCILHTTFRQLGLTLSSCDWLPLYWLMFRDSF